MDCMKALRSDPRALVALCARLPEMLEMDALLALGTSSDEHRIRMEIVLDEVRRKDREATTPVWFRGPHGHA